MDKHSQSSDLICFNYISIHLISFHSETIKMYHLVPFSFLFSSFFRLNISMSRKLRSLPSDFRISRYISTIIPINQSRIELKRLSKLNEIRQRLNDQLSRWNVDKGIRLSSSITMRFERIVVG